MVMIIFHIAYIICLLSNDVWHAYDATGVYKINHGADRVSYFTKPAILWLTDTVMGEVGAHSRGACPLAKRPKPLVRKKYGID